MAMCPPGGIAKNLNKDTHGHFVTKQGRWMVHSLRGLCPFVFLLSFLYWKNKFWSGSFIKVDLDMNEQ